MNADWIDEHVGADADVPFIFTPDLVANPHLLWQTEFWNRSVGDVYGLNAHDPTSVPVVRTTVDARGRIVRALDGDGSLPPLRGRSARDRHRRESRSPLRVACVALPGDPPLRLESQLDGVYGDGWSGRTRRTQATTNVEARSRSMPAERLGRTGHAEPREYRRGAC